MQNSATNYLLVPLRLAAHHAKHCNLPWRMEYGTVVACSSAYLLYSCKKPFNLSNQIIDVIRYRF